MSSNNNEEFPTKVSRKCSDVNNLKDGLLIHVIGLSNVRRTMNADQFELLANEFRNSFYGPSHEMLPFPLKLHMVVSAIGQSSFVFWSSDGNSFAISREGYERYVMSTFFCQSRFKSFQNILHRYGFKRVASYQSESTYDQVIVYQHSCFQRGRRDLCQKIQMINSKTKKHNEVEGKKRKSKEKSGCSINNCENKQPRLGSTQGDNVSINLAHLFHDIESAHQVTAARSEILDVPFLSRQQSFEWSQGAINKMLKDLDAEDASCNVKGLDRLDSISTMSSLSFDAKSKSARTTFAV